MTDRIEDATLHLRPKEEQQVMCLLAASKASVLWVFIPAGLCLLSTLLSLQRLHAVRAWRHQLDKEEHREWVATGLLGPSLRQLAPEYYSAQLEQQIAAAAPAGE